MNLIRQLLSLSIVAQFSVCVTFAQTQSQCELRYVAQDNSNSGAPLPGFEGNYGWISEQVTWMAVVDTTPGCCGDITYPTCKQPVQPVMSPEYNQNWTTTLTQTQSFDAGLSLGAIFKWLTGSAWKVTRGRSYTESNSVAIKFPSQSVGCGSKLMNFVGTVTTKTHETRTHSDRKVYARDEEKKGYATKTRLVGANQSWDPCLEVAVGSKCPPVRADARCPKVAF